MRKIIGRVQWYFLKPILWPEFFEMLQEAIEEAEAETPKHFVEADGPVRFRQLH